MPKVYLDTCRASEVVKYDSVDVSSQFVQVYSDLYSKLNKIPPCAVQFLFWLINKMSDYNQIVLNQNVRNDFILDSRGSYRNSTIKAAIKSLTREGIMTSMNEPNKRESLYFVSPFFFWKNGSQKERAESIKAYIYKLKENETNHI
jgi:hypothetical protein